MYDYVLYVCVNLQNLKNVKKTLQCDIWKTQAKKCKHAHAEGHSNEPAASAELSTI
jgi:hypothetical protein